MVIVGMPQPIKSMFKSQLLLEVVFHFNNRDLYYNRGGWISDRQKLRLRCMQVMSPLHMLMVVIITTSYAILINLAIALIAAFQANNWPFLARLLIGFAGVVLIITLVMVSLIHRLQRLNFDIQNGHVGIRKGMITFRPYIRNKIPFMYILQIEGHEYKVIFWQRWAFHQHAKYAIYATPRIGLILSAERI